MPRDAAHSEAVLRMSGGLYDRGGRIGIGCRWGRRSARPSSCGLGCACFSSSLGSVFYPFSFLFLLWVDFYRGRAPCWCGPGGWDPGGRSPGKGGVPYPLRHPGYLVPVHLFSPSAPGVLPCSATPSLPFPGDSDGAAWAVYLQLRSTQFTRAMARLRAIPLPA